MVVTRVSTAAKPAIRTRSSQGDGRNRTGSWRFYRPQHLRCATHHERSSALRTPLHGRCRGLTQGYQARLPIHMHDRASQSGHRRRPARTTREHQSDCAPVRRLPALPAQTHPSTVPCGPRLNADGGDHRRLRKMLLPLAYGTPCAWWGRPMLPPMSAAGASGSACRRGNVRHISGRGCCGKPLPAVDVERDPARVRSRHRAQPHGSASGAIRAVRHRNGVVAR